MYTVFLIIGGFTLIVLPLLILLHELGHAVPALLFTKSSVTMYLGSHGESVNMWRIQIGSLEVYLKRSIFWRKGLCLYAGTGLSKAQQCVIILGGVMVSVLLAAFGFYGALAINLHGSVKLFMFLLFMYATFSVVTNLVPSRRGGIPNDGLLLKMLLLGDRPTVSFAPELKELIARSREVAIDLGYDHVSTLHVLLADCTMSYPYSLSGLFFPDSEAQTAFYESYRVGPTNLAAGSLPLTVEYEQALKLAPTARQYGFRDDLYPCHLFVAASQVAGAEFGQVVPVTTDLTQVLLTYYRTFDELLTT
jgi:hypothetical protein